MIIGQPGYATQLSSYFPALTPGTTSKRRMPWQPGRFRNSPTPQKIQGFYWLKVVNDCEFYICIQESLKQLTKENTSHLFLELVYLLASSKHPFIWKRLQHPSSFVRGTNHITNEPMPVGFFEARPCLATCALQFEPQQVEAWHCGEVLKYRDGEPLQNILDDFFNHFLKQVSAHLLVQDVIKWLHPGRLTWNIIIEVWRIIFLSKWVICM